MTTLKTKSVEWNIKYFDAGCGFPPKFYSVTSAGSRARTRYAEGTRLTETGASLKSSHSQFSTMESSPSHEKEDDRRLSSSSNGESPLSRRQPPFNQYHVYNFGEAAGNTVGGPAYYYPGYPADYYYPGYCHGFSGAQDLSRSRPDSEPVSCWVLINALLHTCMLAGYGASNWFLNIQGSVCCV